MLDIAYRVKYEMNKAMKNVKNSYKKPVEKRNKKK